MINSDLKLKLILRYAGKLFSLLITTNSIFQIFLNMTNAEKRQTLDQHHPVVYVTIHPIFSW